DITERKRAEQEQERLNAELSQKNAELERVVYVTSHDLRTPLVNIQGFNKELGRSVDELFSSLQKSGLPEEIKEKIAPIVENDIPDSQSYISRSITKMDSLLDGLLKLSRLGSSELNIVKLDMNRLISDVITILRTQSIKAGAKITVSKLPSCYGDESQISQLFANLAGNAVKFLNPDQPGIINITGYKDNDHSVYCVEDNGIGIESDYQGKIFDIFHRLNPSEFKGEGLGLSIVQRAIERHGGKIWVESEPGKGSCFFVSLPDKNKEGKQEC
ncbi:MAG: PAS domain-containing sensor histidine kinase, partial [Thermodesulfovibrionia bacterium]|nr:PAS domain-containing sensor histidine kinase [Thermodesulfovibrionia bacterium]